MKTILFLFTTAISLIAEPQKNHIDIRFSKNMELFGYIIELGDPSDNNPNHPISLEINKWPEDRDSPILNEIFEIGADMDYGQIIGVLYAMPDFPIEGQFEVPLEVVSKNGYNSEAEINAITALIDKVNEFSRQSNFEAVWANLAPYRTETGEIIDEMKPSKSVISEMEEFYETRFSSYEIVPSLTIWSGPGWGIKNYKKNTASFVLGPLNKNYDFNDQRFQNLAIHEFGHSFVNDVVLLNEDLISATENLFTSVKEDMTPQGYNTWKTCMIEHFVRAGEIIIPELLGDFSQSRDLMEDYVENRKFIYLPFIVDQLKYYRMEKKYSYEASVRKTLEDVKKKLN
jgi:hypothetical protein